MGVTAGAYILTLFAVSNGTSLTLFIQLDVKFLILLET
jgi:hypothetical protein